MRAEELESRLNSNYYEDLLTKKTIEAIEMTYTEPIVFICGHLKINYIGGNDGRI